MSDDTLELQYCVKYMHINYYYQYYEIYKAHKFKQARVRGAGVARWGTWLAGKGKEVSFETAFERTNEW